MNLDSEIELHSVGNTDVYIWNHDKFPVNGAINHLLPEEKQRLQKFKHQGRSDEFIATRILCRYLFGNSPVLYNSVGAPYINDEVEISFSHCERHVAIAINRNHVVGLDIELPRKKALYLSNKFMSEEELYLFKKDHVEITKVWSAKEAMYKLAGRKKIIFKEELLLKKSSDTQWKGTIVNPENNILVNLNIFERNGLIISTNQDAPIEKLRNIQSNQKP